MPTELTPTTAVPVEAGILKVLRYFEIFSWPLTAEEVWHFYAGSTTPSMVQQQLAKMVYDGKIFQFGAYFQMANAPEWSNRRAVYNQSADQFIPIAKRMARLIGAFPFVRGVFISGSLSKHAMAPDSDVDFFIITAPERLWLARMLLVLFKRVFLFNSHKYFCVNYFVDANHVIIQEQNIYTATEMVTMLPMYGADWYQKIKAANPWAWEMLPNFPERSVEAVPDSTSKGSKKILEWLLSGRLGTWSDLAAMRLNLAFWRRKFRHLSDADFAAVARSTRYESKYHPLQYQDKVLKMLEK